jgi:hydrogenase maturation protease
MRILVACVGNIFFGDDAFGVEVAHHLSRCSLPDGVSVIDFGIRGIDLTYALLDGYSVVILVDAVSRGGPPGTLYLIEPAIDETDLAGSRDLLDAHRMDSVRILRLAASLGGKVDRFFLVGCEPATTGQDGGMVDGLSIPVKAAAGEAVDLVLSLIERLLRGEAIEARNHGLNTVEESERCGAKQPIR